MNVKGSSSIYTPLSSIVNARTGGNDPVVEKIQQFFEVEGQRWVEDSLPILFSGKFCFDTVIMLASKHKSLGERARNPEKDF